MVRRLALESRIPPRMFLRGGGGGVANADDEEFWRVCAGFSPGSLMVIVKKKNSGCVCVVCLVTVSVKLRRQK